MSLYLKYRPDSIEQMRGNSEILDTLSNMLHKPEIPRVYLFHGPTGCGKTTLARILLKMVNCEQEDIKEIDSADFRGIDTIRDVRKNAQFKPFKSPYRGYIVDECHKLTNDAQNALLKILEDTPKHAIFILCTTDPNKLISAIRGRCQQFEVKPLDDSQMYGLLRKISREEGVKLEKEVYDQIILDSQGHPRNAIQILEQVLNAPEETRLQIARATAERSSQAIELCRALINRKGWKEISQILEGLKQNDAEEIRRVVLGYSQSVLLKNENDLAAAIIEAFYEPTYNIGFPGIVFACYQIIKS